QIKDILKDHDTQNHILPLKFHRHIKPPLHPPQRHLVEKEVVAGKKVPFTKREAQLKAGIEQWLLKKTDDAPELKQIKNILKTHDTQHHLLPLAFHKRIKPPVSPPRRLLFKAEVVAGKRVPFTKALAVKDRKRMDVIYESDDYEKEKRQSTYSTQLLLH
ncbi:hypothetical protein DYB28_009289, partial [Aphanomyces astaci]